MKVSATGVLPMTLRTSERSPQGIRLPDDDVCGRTLRAARKRLCARAVSLLYAHERPSMRPSTRTGFSHIRGVAARDSTPVGIGSSRQMAIVTTDPPGSRRLCCSQDGNAAAPAIYERFSFASGTTRTLAVRRMMWRT